MSFQYPTIRQLCEATLVGIASHPRIKNPGIYYPIRQLGLPAEEIKVIKWRQGGGMEILEGELSCSVYPFFAARSLINGAPSQAREKSCTFKPYTLGGSTTAGEATVEATYQIVVELSYRDVAIGETRKIKYAALETNEELFTPHYLNFAPDASSTLAIGGDVPGRFNRGEITPSETLQGLRSLDMPTDHCCPPSSRQAASVRPLELEVEINPAELILQDYMDLMRLVLGDMRFILPYRTKSTFVKSIDFPTSSWSQNNENLVFHMAYLIWEISLYPPSSWQQLKEFTPANYQELNVSVAIGEDCSSHGETVFQTGA